MNGVEYFLAPVCNFLIRAILLFNSTTEPFYSTIEFFPQLWTQGTTFFHVELIIIETSGLSSSSGTIETHL